MTKRITQRDCRRLIGAGEAVNATAIAPENLAEIAGAVETVALGHGTYGINCELFRHVPTGRLYAAPTRSAALFTMA